MTKLTITFKDTDTQGAFETDLVLAKPQIAVFAGGASSVGELPEEFRKWGI